MDKKKKATKARVKKRKQSNNDDDNDDDDNKEIIDSVFESIKSYLDKNLEEKAAKNKLTKTNVKNILKCIITNDDVLEMVKNAINAESSSEAIEPCAFEPKVTRSKAKEFLENKKPLPWPLTPIKTDAPESACLIKDEFLDECSEDEDYMPDESELHKSDEESLFSPNSIPLLDCSPCPVESVHSECMDAEEQSDPIPYRTRSKVPMTDFPIEIIEQSFIPPDITTDMYETHCDDEDWQKFLLEFAFPKGAASENGDDDDADPEYNFMNESIELKKGERKEEMRFDRGVKISQKEIQQLMNELVDDFDLSYFDEKEVEKEPEVKKKKPKTNEIIEKFSLQKEKDEPILSGVLSAKHLEVLAFQMQLHIQLLLQSVMMTSELVELKKDETLFRNLMLELRAFSGGNAFSIFRQPNLEPAIEFMSTHKAIPYNMKLSKNSKRVRRNQFGVEVRKDMLESPAFHFAQLLPVARFCVRKRCYRVFNSSDDRLIAFAFKMFTPYLTELNGQCPSISELSHTTCKYIIQHGRPRYVHLHVKYQRNRPSIIKKFFETGEVPEPIYPCGITLNDKITYLPVAPIYKASLLPPDWQTFVKHSYELNVKTKQWKKKISLENTCVSSLSIYNEGRPVFFVISNPPKDFTPVSCVNALNSLSPQAVLNSQLEEKPQAREPNFIKGLDTSSKSRRRKKSKAIKTSTCVKAVNSSIQIANTGKTFKSDLNKISMEPPGECNFASFNAVNNIVDTNKNLHTDLPRQANRKGKCVRFCLGKDSRAGCETSSGDVATEIFVRHVKQSSFTCNQELASIATKEIDASVFDIKCDPDQPFIPVELGMADFIDQQIFDKASAVSYLKKIRNNVPNDVWNAFFKAFHGFNKEPCDIMKLHGEIKMALQSYPDFVEEFWSILLSDYSQMIVKQSNHSFIIRIEEFFKSVLSFFSAEPFYLEELEKYFRKVISNSDFSCESMRKKVSPLLKGNKLLLNQLNGILESFKPIENLRFNAFENDESYGEQITYHIFQNEKFSARAICKSGCSCNCHSNSQQDCPKCNVFISPCLENKIILDSRDGTSIQKNQSCFSNDQNDIAFSKNGSHLQLNENNPTMKNVSSHDHSTEDDGKLRNQHHVQTSHTSQDCIPNSTMKMTDFHEKVTSSEASVNWTEEEDRVILMNFKKFGTNVEVVDIIQEQLCKRSKNQVNERLSYLLSLIMKELN